MTILLFFILLSSLFLSRKIITIPPYFSISIVTNVLLAFCSFFLIIDSILYDFDISALTVFVIFISSVCLLMGELFGFYFIVQLRKQVSSINVGDLIVVKNKKERSITFLIIFGIIIQLIVIYFQLNRVYQIGQSYSANTLFEYLAFYRIHDVNIQLGKVKDDIVPLGNIFSLFTALTFVIFCFNIVIVNVRRVRLYKLLFILFFILMLVSAMLTGGRTNILILILAYLLIKKYFNMYKINYMKSLTMSNYVLQLMIGMLLLFALYLINYFRANGVEEITFFTFYESISRYLASSFVGLDVTLNKGITDFKLGSYTLPSFYLILEKLDFGNFHIINLSDDFFNYRGEKSNVYTALAKPYWDFGFLGLFISRLLLGIFYGLFEGFITCQKSNIMNAILLVVFFWPVFMYPFDDLFIGLQQLYIFFVLIFAKVISVRYGKFIYMENRSSSK